MNTVLIVGAGPVGLTLALELVRQGYKVGNAGIVQIVTAQRLQQLADLGVVQARAQRYADTVKLCLASGGGVI